MPCEKNLLNYKTTTGIVKHFFGFNWTLGGIVSFTGADFEKVNGFPNYWGWGQEDNDIHERVKNYNIKIDRSQFYNFSDTRIINIKNEPNRTLSKQQIFRSGPNNNEGLVDIKNLKYNFENDMVNVTYFTTRVNPLKDHYYEFDPRLHRIPIADLKYRPNDSVNTNEELIKWGLVPGVRDRSRSRGIGMKLF